ncbi:MAG: hypothetical protein E7614_02095 [Ruminococcaceae bacterium]|nr:hypothetical protein [Oscillospiraceae bacterium]
MRRLIGKAIMDIGEEATIIWPDGKRLEAEYVDTFGYDHILKAKEDGREIRLTNRYIARMGILVVKKK